jgi:3-oxoadipate enol-lactonase
VPSPSFDLGLRVSEPMSARERGFVRTGGPRIYFEVSGRKDAPPLLLIRGLARSSSYWLEVRQLFETERRLIVLDNRGVGRSDCPPPPWTTADMADDIAEVLSYLEIDRTDVFGISLGGMIAQSLALRHPRRIDRLILACTSAGGRTAKRVSPLAALALVRAATMPFAEGLRFSAPWVLSEQAMRTRPEIVDIWIAIANSEPRSRLGVLSQLVAAARHDASAHLHHIEHRALVITGDADRLIHPDNSRSIAKRLPNARLHTLAGAGHDFPTERPEETARVVLDFLRES